MIRYIVFFLLFIVTYSANAQQVRIGPKFGVQLSRPYYDNPEFYTAYTPQYGLGFSGGGVINVKASDHFSLHTELLYQRVAKNIEGTNGYEINRERYNYLSAPLLLRGTMHLGRLEMYLNAGPSVNYWLGGKGFLRHSELIEPEIYETNYRIGFGEQTRDELITGTVHVTHPNRIQLGLDAGVGVVIPAGGTYLMVDLRYNWGHTNMAQPDTEYVDLVFYNDNLTFANHSFGVSFAYLYELDLVKLTRKGKSKTIKGKGIGKAK